MTTTEEISRDENAEELNLPDGWRLVTLGELCKIVQGEALGLPEFKPSGFPVYGANGRIGFYTRYHYEDPQVLVSCRGANCGVVNFSEPKSYVTNNSMAMLVKDANQLDRDYLRWALEGGAAKAAISGSAQPQITRESLSVIQIPLPPLAEQKRIAGILKEQMAAVERARASAEAQLQAAEHLPAAYLRAVFENGESKAWQRKSLGDLCKIVQGEALGLPEFTAGGFPVYGANGRIGFYTRYHYEESQVLVSCRGANCGVVNFSEPKSYVTNNSMTMLVKDVSQLDRDYLRWALEGGAAKAAISGSAQPQITRESLSPIEIPVPSPTDQRRIAAQLSSQMASAERLRQTLTDQLDAINKLPAALLRRAFNGEI